MIYRIFNYQTIGPILLTMIFSVLIIIGKYLDRANKLKNGSKNQNLSLKEKVIGIIILLVIVFSVLLFPYEIILLKNQSIENMLKYYYPNNRILKKYEHQDYAYVYYIANGTPFFSRLIKKDNRWMYDGKKTRGLSQKGSYLDSNHIYVIMFNTIYEKNVTAVFITYESKDNKGISVKDSMNSVYQESFVDGLSGYRVLYFTEIKGDFDDKYTITVNDKEYKIYKKYKK